MPIAEALAALVAELADEIPDPRTIYLPDAIASGESVRRPV